ncbi:hypothetical protein L873DRAFT_1845881 [Choiromyces venosus 120613-1]|uniref:Uncharacterized protein n=1 Tax=Choiromyces venosus 120613-1 TaxID=1336337 RepID=A0A3N4JBA8_9PEZI|nr:hypothetical protein L873DRAFT_1845881 [Choiromyces venosus 120613-1]
MVSAKRKKQLNLALLSARERKNMKSKNVEIIETLDSTYEGQWDSADDISSGDSVEDSESGDDRESEFDNNEKEENEGEGPLGYEDECGDSEINSEISDLEDGSKCKSQQISDLKYHEGAGTHLRASWGSGSDRSKRRKHEEARQLKEEGARCYDIRALWDQARMVGLCKAQDDPENCGESEFFGSGDRIPSLDEVPRGCSPPRRRRPTRIERQNAISDLTYLLNHKKKIKEKYGDRGLIGTYQLRHEMVLQFLHAQLRKENHGFQCHRWGMHTARMLVQWESSWVQEREIQRSQQGGGDGRLVTWFEDEGVLLAVREYIMRTGEKVTSRSLAKAVANYLKPADNDQLEDALSHSVINRENPENEEVEELVLEAIERVGIQDGYEETHHRKRKGIRARTARRWLARLGFHWTEVRKGVYIDGHERPDVVEE